MAQNISLDYSTIIGTKENIFDFLKFLRSGTVGNVSMVGCNITFLNKPITNEQIKTIAQTTPAKQRIT